MVLFRLAMLFVSSLIAIDTQIRLPDHYPCGLIGIDGQLSDGTLADPIPTLVRHSKATRPMKFAINAATNVSFMGDRYIHSYVSHQFSGSTGAKLSVTARARQFSCFVLLLGTITGPDTFDPKFATIVRDKDDLNIPVLCETVSRSSSKEY